MHRRRGMTLVEMVISTALLAGMMTATFAITAAVSGHTATQRQIAERQTNVRTVLTRITNDIASAPEVGGLLMPVEITPIAISESPMVISVSRESRVLTDRTVEPIAIEPVSEQPGRVLVSATATQIELKTAAFRFSDGALWVQDAGEKSWTKLLEDVPRCRWRFYDVQGKEMPPPGRSAKALAAVHRVGLALTATVAGHPATFETSALPWCRLKIPSEPE